MQTTFSSDVMRDGAFFTSRSHEPIDSSSSISSSMTPSQPSAEASAAAAAATAARSSRRSPPRQQPPSLTSDVGSVAPLRGGHGRPVLFAVRDRDYAGAIDYASSHGYNIPDLGSGDGAAITSVNNESERLAEQQQQQSLVHATATPSSASATEDRSLASSQLHAGGTRPDRRRRYSQALQTPLPDTGLTTGCITTAAGSPTGSDESSGPRSPRSPLGVVGLHFPSSRRSSCPMQVGKLEGSRQSGSHSATALASHPPSLVSASRLPAEGRFAPLTPVRSGERISSPPQPSPQGPTRAAIDCTPAEADASNAAAATLAPVYTSGAQSGVVAHSSIGRETLMRERATSRSGPALEEADRGRSSPSATARRHPSLKPDAVAMAPLSGTPHSQTGRRGSGRGLHPPQNQPPPLSSGTARNSISTASSGQPQPPSSSLVASSPTSAAPSPPARHAAGSRSGSEAFSMHAIVSRSKKADNFDYGLRALGFPVEDCRRASKLPTAAPTSSANNSLSMPTSTVSGPVSQGPPSPRGVRGGVFPSASATVAEVPAVTGTGDSSLPPLTRRQSELRSTSSGMRRESRSMLSMQIASPLCDEVRYGGGLATHFSSSPSSSSSLSGDAAPKAAGDDDVRSGLTKPTAEAAASAATATATAAPGKDGSARGLAEDVRLPPLFKKQGSNHLPAPPAAPLTTSDTSSPTLAASSRRCSDTAAAAASGGGITVAPIFAMTRGCRDSPNALTSASWRSTMLHPRRLPYSLDFINGDLARSSSNNVFTGSAYSSLGGSGAAGALGCAVTGHSSVMRSSLATERGVAGSHVDVHAGCQGRCVASSFAVAPTAVAHGAACQAARQLSLYKSSSDYEDDSSSHTSSDDDDDDDDEDAVFSFDNAEADLSGVRRTAGPLQRRQRRSHSDEEKDSVTVEGSAQVASFSAKTRLSGSGGGGGGRGARMSGSEHSSPRGEDDNDSAAVLRRPSHRRPDTFLPFEDGIASGPRGFSSLVVSSFLRHAGSPLASAAAAGSWVGGWSPSPSSSITFVAQLTAGRCSTADSTSPPSASGVTAVMASGSDEIGHSQPSVLHSGADGTPLGPLSVPDTVTTALSDRAFSLQLGTGSSQAAVRGAGQAVGAPQRQSHVPRPPSGVWAGGHTAPPRPGSGLGGALNHSSGFDGAAEAPPELVQAGVLRWAKPRSHAHGAANGAAEREAVRGVTVLERTTTSTAAPRPATARVFAVDGGYTVRVVQGDLVGDCETDEHVERCTTSAAAAASSSADAPAPPLPSVAVDEAVSRFVEDGENSIAVVMATAEEFLRQRRAAPARDAPRDAPATTAPASTRSSRPSPSPPPVPLSAGVEGSAAACRYAGVAEAMCMRVVQHFLRHKAAQAAAHEDFVADLKVAVALVPVSLAEPSMTLMPAAVSASEDRGIFYDVVQTASTDVAGSRRPLEVATSPVFGPCLNGCQWLLVEEESDVAAVFELVQRLAVAIPPHTQGFLYIQFLHQCFVPERLSSAVPGGTGPTGSLQAPTRRRPGAASVAQPTAAHCGDIVVSSFTLATSSHPSVFEAMLDQRADTPWPLLRYALGKGPCAVLVVVEVHEEDAEAAYPLSILQRMKAAQHPPPRRGSMRDYVREQHSKLAELRWRLASTAEAAATAPEMQATTKRLTVLISKLECGARDAEDFLADPESAHVPVYVDPRWPGQRDAGAVGTQLPKLPAKSETAVTLAAGICAVPLMLAMVQHYSTATGFAAQAGPHWAAAAANTATANAVPTAAVKLTAQLSATSSPTAFDVCEVTSLGGIGGAAEEEWRRCATWHHLRERVRGGYNATAAVMQEAQDANRVWSLRAVLELVHGVLKDAWGTTATTAAVPSAQASLESSRQSTNTGSSGFAAAAAAAWEVVRVVVAVYHCSGDAVADLLCTPTTSRAKSRTAAGGAISFVPVKAAVRPLAGAAAPPLNVSSRAIGSLAELETLLKEAAEGLLTAQTAAAAAASASSGGGAADEGGRQWLLAPGYTVVTVELTQQTTTAAAVAQSSRRTPSPLTTAMVDKLGSAEAGEDVRVSTLTVVDLAGHYALLAEAAHAANATTTGTGKAGAAAALPSAACARLARLLLHQRDLTVCAVALPAAPTTEAVNSLLRCVADFQTTALRLAPGTAPSLNSVRQLITHLRGVLRVAEVTTDGSGNGGAAGPSLVNLRDAVKRALAVLRDPRSIAFTSYAFTVADAEAMELPPTPPMLRVDGASLRGSTTTEAATWLQVNNSCNLATNGTVSTLGGGGSTSLGDLSGSATEKEGRAAGRSSSPGDARTAAAEVTAPRPNPPTGMHAFAAAVSAGNSLRAEAAEYYGVRYDRAGDAPLLRRDVTTSLCPPARRGGAAALPSQPPRAVAPHAGPQKGGATRDRGAAAAAPAASDADNAEDEEQVTVPTVLVLNAATTGAHVKRQGMRVRIPIVSAPTSSSPSSPTSAAPAAFSGADSALPPSPQCLSLEADEVVNIKPTSMGLKSTLLMRSVSCVSRGRTAALLVADTESCDATSSIAWLTMRTVMGGIFQSLKMKEAEGVQHAAAMRAFLIEEGQGDAFADLLAPNLTAIHPRRTLTRLKYSPFCGPAPADATAVPVKDLQDVNVALASVLLGARLARQSAAAAAANAPAESEVLRGCVVLQLTFHQYVPATGGSPEDVVVSSLWCAHMGCSAGWMSAATGPATSPPSSGTAALLRFWLGGPCYTTSVTGFSRYRGVRGSSWRAVIEAQERAHPVVLRRPRPGSVRGYVEYLKACLAHSTGDAHPGGDPRANSPSFASVPTRSQSAAGRGAAAAGSSSSSSWTSDSVTRVTALLKEAQRMLDRGADVGRPLKHNNSSNSSLGGGGSQAPVLGLLSHEEKTFAALDSVRGGR